MAKRKARRGKAGKHLPALIDPRLMKGLEHVLRQHILMAAVQGEVSPKGLSGLLDEGLSQVNYHVEVLRDLCGLIEETRTVPRRGALEHYYRATTKTLLPAKAWRGLEKGLRKAVGAGMASDLFDDLAGALKADKLGGRHDHLARVPLALDEEGKRNVCGIAQRARREVEREQRKASQRMADRNGSGGGSTGFTFAVFALEAAWDVADPRALAAEAEGEELDDDSGSAKSKAAEE